MLMRKLVNTHASLNVILIRLIVGGTFFSEGIQKFVYPDALGAGRFAKIGIPAPEAMASFVGSIEILCGLLLLAGFAVRAAVIPLIITMLVALATTKLPILMKSGLFSFAHEARVDVAMLLGSVFLFLSGAGGGSVDARLTQAWSSAAPKKEKEMPSGGLYSPSGSHV